MTKGHWIIIIFGSYLIYGLVGGFLLINDYEVVDCNVMTYDTYVNKRDKYKELPTIQEYKFHYEYEMNGKTYKSKDMLKSDNDLVKPILKGSVVQKLYISTFNHRFNSLTKPSDKIPLGDYIYLGFLSIITLMGMVPLLYQFGILKPTDENDIMNMYIKKSDT